MEAAKNQSKQRQGTIFVDTGNWVCVLACYVPATFWWLCHGFFENYLHTVYKRVANRFEKTGARYVKLGLEVLKFKQIQFCLHVSLPF